MSVRSTQEILEILGNAENSAVRVTQDYVEVAGRTTDTDARVEAQVVEVLANDSTAKETRVSKLAVEVGGRNETVESRVSQLFIEVLGQINLNQVGENGIVLSGESQVVLEFLTESVGGIDLSGDATSAQSITYVADTSNPLQLSGNQDNYVTYVNIVDGQLIELSGSAITTQVETMSYIGSGEIDLSGEAFVVLNISTESIGGLTLDGFSLYTSMLTYTADTGTPLLLSGNQDNKIDYLLFPDGSVITLSGAAQTGNSESFSYVGSGQMDISGDADYFNTAIFQYAGTGGIALSVDIDVVLSLNLEYSPLGNLLLSGTSNYNASSDLRYSSEGGLELGSIILAIKSTRGGLLLDCSGLHGLPGGDKPIVNYPQKCGCRIGLEDLPLKKKRKGENCIPWRFVSSGCSTDKQKKGINCGSRKGAFVTKTALCSRNLFFFDDPPCQRRLTNDLGKDP